HRRSGKSGPPAKIKTVVGGLSGPKRSSIKRKGLLIAGVIIVALAIASFLFWQQKKPKTSAIAAAISDKSIAVLPFENLSEEKANAYFVAGMQDEILTALAKISDLK